MSQKKVDINKGERITIYMFIMYTQHNLFFYQVCYQEITAFKLFTRFYFRISSFAVITKKDFVVLALGWNKYILSLSSWKISSTQYFEKVHLWDLFT